MSRSRRKGRNRRQERADDKTPPTHRPVLGRARRSHARRERRGRKRDGGRHPRVCPLRVSAARAERDGPRMSLRDSSPNVDFGMLDEDEFLDLYEDRAAAREQSEPTDLLAHGFGPGRRPRGRSHLISALAAAAVVAAALAARSLLSPGPAPMPASNAGSPFTAPRSHQAGSSSVSRRSGGRAREGGPGWRSARHDLAARGAGSPRREVDVLATSLAPPSATPRPAATPVSGTDFGFER
jgi:hypothetical protein